MVEQDADKAGARADLCRFLSACYYEPDPAFAEERLFDSMLEAARRVDPELGERALGLGQAFAADDLQTLLVDYTRLFLGPVQALARPYGSFWLSGDTTLMQDSTMSVLELYREGGFDLGDEFMEVPDHVAVELEFLYLLTFTRSQAATADDVAKLTDTEALRRRFLDEHLGAWIGSFAGAVAAGAQTSFYRELAGLTALFVRMEAAASSAAH